MNKSLGQQLWEVSGDEMLKAGEPSERDWEHTYERYKRLYEKIAKRLYKSWSRKAINEYRKNYK